MVSGDQLSKVVTRLGKKKGIHYRPHRVEPDKFIVIKLYLEFDRQILVDYLAAIGLVPEDGIIRGSIKWVAIIDRKKFEKKIGKKVKGKGRISNKNLLDALNKAKKKTKTKTKVKTTATTKIPAWKQAKLDGGQQSTKVPSWKKATLDMPQDQKQKQGTYQKVYQLTMSAEQAAAVGVLLDASIVEASKFGPFKDESALNRAVVKSAIATLKPSYRKHFATRYGGISEEEYDKAVEELVAQGYGKVNKRGVVSFDRKTKEAFKAEFKKMGIHLNDVIDKERYTNSKHPQYKESLDATEGKGSLTEEEQLTADAVLNWWSTHPNSTLKANDLRHAFNVSSQKAGSLLAKLVKRGKVTMSRGTDQYGRVSRKAAEYSWAGLEK